MKIRELKIKRFRNLHNFEINFSQDITMLLGKNGSAKSNLIEAIATIFSDIELGEPPSFDYYLHYECKSRSVKIYAKTGEKNSPVKIDEEEIDYRKFVEEKAPVQGSEDAATEIEDEVDEEGNQRRREYISYFPSNVIIYYSGLSDRLKKVCDPVKEKYKTELRYGTNPPLRRVFLTDGSHSSLILFTFFTKGAQRAKDFLLSRLGIADLESVRLSLERPKDLDATERADSSLRTEHEKYWDASGRILETLKMLRQYSIPLRDFRKKPDSATEILSRLHFYFGPYSKPDALPAIRPKDLFQQLDDLGLDGYGLDLHFELKLEKSSETVSLTHLSEGEQQLLTVIGLLRFTKDNDTLFLLDEPDTHLNPQWSYEYKKMLKEAMEGATGCQIIMATHDPVLIAGLTKENVRLMERKRSAETPDESEQIIETREPDEDPQGKGVARILEGELFGLPSILDKDSLNKLEEKRRLAFKEEMLTKEEEERLFQLAMETQDIDLTTHVEDPLYTHFVNAVVNHEDYLLLKRHYSRDTRFTVLKRISEKVREELLRKAKTAEVAEEED